jgi:lysophospholipase
MFQNDEIKGCVLECYGVGNFPMTRQDLLDEFSDASDNGKVVVYITQCERGNVMDAYETGRFLKKRGIIPGFNMTVECAVAKLCYLIGKGYELSVIKSMM